MVMNSISAPNLLNLLNQLSIEDRLFIVESIITNTRKNDEEQLRKFLRLSKRKQPKEIEISRTNISEDKSNSSISA